jgi:membrane protein involved in colicin uptake
MCVAKIADPVGVFNNKTTARLADPLGLTDTWIGDPADVLGKRAAKTQAKADALAADQAAATAQANRPRQASKAPVYGLDTGYGGGASGYSTLLTGSGGGGTLLGA